VAFHLSVKDALCACLVCVCDRVTLGTEQQCLDKKERQHATGKLSTLVILWQMVTTTLKHNSINISCSQLEGLGYEIQWHFWQRQIEGQGQAIPMIHSGNIYTLQCAGKPQFDYTTCNQQ
jgi:hypothetical protein